MSEQIQNRLLFENIGNISEPEQHAAWEKMLIEMEIPEKLNKLKQIIYNLWWTWNDEAYELFQMVNEELWELTGQNPVKMFESLSYQQLSELENNKDFNQQLDSVYILYSEYMSRAHIGPQNPIAYFSMEYGLSDHIPVYSGGLGMLAGDYLKEASDNSLNMVAVGLLYRFGYFKQQISLFGDQIADYKRQRFSKMSVKPLFDDHGNEMIISVDYPGKTIFAKIWQLDIGKVPLYLMDTDINENNEEDKFITHQLYGGDNENRLKQEYLLGIGGIKLLRSLNISPSLYHCNEGHSAFISLSRLENYIKEQDLTMDEAIELIRSTTLFTTHTPVPAGHDKFKPELMKKYFANYVENLKLDWDSFLALGRSRKHHKDEEFSMSHLAIRCSQETNGVSKLHGIVAKDMFQNLFPGYFADELYMGHVTNGVHYHTWTSPLWKQLYKDVYGEGFGRDQSNPDYWNKIHNVSDEKIIQIRKELKQDLIKYLKKRVNNDLTKRQEDPNLIINTVNAIHDDALIIGFARRFATYKRGYLLFQNLDRLAKLVNIENKPVIFLFAGKAHPHDKAGQEVIKNIIEISKRPEFLGKIIFIENYNIEVAKKLVQGVDVWFNTPTRLMEASGTSGQKAIMNGVLNFSVLDGWWAEGYKENAGWALSENRTYANQDIQNKLDAEVIYSKFENEIIPLYFNDEKAKEENELTWVEMIKNCISGIAPHFTMKRMLDDYQNLYYTKLLERTNILQKDNYKEIKNIVKWKQNVNLHWGNIEVISKDLPKSHREALKVGNKFNASITLKADGISENDIGLEIIFRQNMEDEDENRTVVIKQEMDNISKSHGKVTFKASFVIEKAGVYDYAIRMFPKHPLLPHKQDIQLVRWL